jgi:hypothetical protein
MNRFSYIIIDQYLQKINTSLEEIAIQSRKEHIWEVCVTYFILIGLYLACLVNLLRPIYGLFNDAVSSSDYRASNFTVINE